MSDTSAIRLFIFRPWPYYKEIFLFSKETIQALGSALRPLVPSAGLRDTTLIGELLILQGVWVPDFSINASLCILLSHHKNDIGGQQVIYKSCVLKPC